MLLANIKNFLLLYFRPAKAMSGLIDSGSWWIALGLFVAVSFVFHFEVKERVLLTYGDQIAVTDLRARLESMQRGYDPGDRGYDEDYDEGDQPAPLVGDPVAPYIAASFQRSAYLVSPVPGLGRLGRWLLWSMPQSWLAGMASLCLFYVPATIFALS
jgi:hypothetical protein